MELQIIQSGFVEVMHYFDKSKEEFVIERLFRGSVINHNSFLMNDGNDTDAICRNNVTIFYLKIDTLKQIRTKYIELDHALDKQEMMLVKGNRREPAIDYIICDPYSNQHFLRNAKSGQLIHDFAKEQRMRKLTVILKNSILRVWLDVQENRNKLSINDMVNNLVNQIQRDGDKKKSMAEKLK